jgi:hypothetical protein
MKLFLICEDIDLGYHCHGVFDDENVAKEQMELLIEACADLDFFGRERPDDYRDYFKTFYIEPCTLNDVSIIQEGIEWREKLLAIYKSRG